MPEIAFKREAAIRGELNPRDIKIDFAKEIVQRFHGGASGQNAAREFIARFREGAMPENIPDFQIPVGMYSFPQILKQVGLTESTSAAMRMIDQGGVKLDGERVSDKGLVLEKGEFVVQVGKRKFARLKVG